MLKIVGDLWNTGDFGSERRANIEAAVSRTLVGPLSDYKLTFEITESGLKGKFDIDVKWSSLGLEVRLPGLCEEDVDADRVWEFIKEQDVADGHDHWMLHLFQEIL